MTNILLTLQRLQVSTYSDVEAEQLADHGGHGRQDDDLGHGVDQRVDGQTQQPEGSVQLLESSREASV